MKVKRLVFPILVLVLLLSLSACITARETVSEVGAAQIDHIILGVYDLDVGIDQLDQLIGLRAVYGGTHPHYGTHNALVALGRSTYLEILAPAPGAELAPFLEPLRSLSNLTPVGWVISVENVAATARSLEQRGFTMREPVAGSRPHPDGSTLSWLLVSPGIGESSSVPSFIEWGSGSVHPAAGLPFGADLAGLQLFDPNPERLRRLLADLRINAQVSYEARAGIRIELETAAGVVRL